MFDRTVVITGASGNVGGAVRESFRTAGWRAVLQYQKTPPDAVATSEVAIRADLRTGSGARAFIDEALAATGRIDALVNLVGGYAGGTVVETDDALWDRMIALNLTSAFAISRAVLPHLLDKRSGRIIHVSSYATERPYAGAAAYITAKAGLSALTKALSMELVGTGVTAHAVLPTTIDTPPNRQSMPDADRSKWVQPGSLADVLLFLASDTARDLNGALIPVGA